MARTLHSILRARSAIPAFTLERNGNTTLRSRTLETVDHWIQLHLTHLFSRYGYWTVFVGVMVESMGVPLPGETILILASVLAATSGKLNILHVAVVAVIAAIAGDNIGYLAGKSGGRPLLRRYGHLFHIGAETLAHGEEKLRRYGPITVFIGRFIAGLRMLIGPLAGVLRMPWKRFFIFNALGAIAWVAVVAAAAYLLGPAIEPLLRKAGWILIATIVVAAGACWWRGRRQEDAQDRKAA
ncbi:MAG TPA: DedA family protein [Candidatus Limnocylindrales bacterium]|nr:DedA family protein [Candidatus Limnocylindrales bacterium]